MNWINEFFFNSNFDFAGETYSYFGSQILTDFLLVIVLSFMAAIILKSIDRLKFMSEKVKLTMKDRIPRNRCKDWMFYSLQKKIRKTRFKKVLDEIYLEDDNSSK